MKTILEITTLAEGFLARKGITSPRLEAEWLVSEALGLKRLELYVYHDRVVSEAEQAIIRPLLERRGKREPLQYLFGQVEFLECIFKVTPDVLIPRPETEILADKIVKYLSKQECKDKVLWDICTGSGCLGISIKKRLPDLKVILSDLSHAALAVAKENAKLNEVEVDFLEGDLLAPFEGRFADYIVSNPPYISDKEFNALEPEVKDFEPIGALVSGPTGKEFYSRLAIGLPACLKPEGIAWMEIGPADTQELFTTPDWVDKLTEDDWSGIPRFLTVKRGSGMKSLEFQI